MTYSFWIPAPGTDLNVTQPFTDQILNVGANESDHARRPTGRISSVSEIVEENSTSGHIVSTDFANQHLSTPKERLVKRWEGGALTRNRPSWFRDSGWGIDCGTPAPEDCTAILEQLSNESRFNSTNKYIKVAPHGQIIISDANCVIWVKNYDDVEHTVSSLDIATAVGIMIGELLFYLHSYGGTMASHWAKIFYVLTDQRMLEDSAKMASCVRDGAHHMTSTREPHRLIQSNPRKDLDTIGWMPVKSNVECGVPHPFHCGVVIKDALGSFGQDNWAWPNDKSITLRPGDSYKLLDHSCGFYMYNDSHDIAEFSQLDVLIDAIALAAEVYRGGLWGARALDLKGCCLRAMMANPFRLTTLAKYNLCARGRPGD